MQKWVSEAPAFQIATRWDKANPTAQEPDYYAYILVGEQSAAEFLVSQGWARAHGRPVPGPHGESPTEMLSKLQNLERQARAAKLGAWGWAERTPEPAH